jgi:hypothetical protein
MTMKISETLDYDATPDAVFDMITDPAFQEQKCVDTSALAHEVSITPTREGARVLTRRHLPTEGLPDFARSLVGSRLVITETYEWAGKDAAGARSGTLVVHVEGAPITLHARVSLAPAMASSTLTIVGDLKASVPLVGGRIERAAAPSITYALESEGRTGQRWLAGRA